MSNTTHLGALAERLKEATHKLGAGETNEERELNHQKFREVGDAYIKALIKKVKEDE